MAILGITMFGNTVDASSITGTKERIKEIKIVEEQSIDKLLRTKKFKITANYAKSKVEEVKETKTEDSNKIDRTKTEKKQTSRSKSTNRKSNKKEESKKTEQKETKVTSNNISISKNMDLTVRTGLSKSEFKAVMKNLSQDTSKFFYNNAETIYDVCEKYQINEIFFCGLISAESGWNIASNHKNTHNYISMMSSKGLIKYSSDEEGLEAATKLLHNKYLTKGGSCYYGKTLSCVQKRFCPNSSTWVGLVYGCMKQVIK